MLFRTYRHIDHRFEWTRREFKDFVNAIIHKYPGKICLFLRRWNQ